MQEVKAGVQKKRKKILPLLHWIQYTTLLRKLNQNEHYSVKAKASVKKYANAIELRKG